MAEIKQIKLPNGITYDIIDATAIHSLKSLKAGTKTYNGSTEMEFTAADFGLSGAMKFLGTSSTAITDGATTNPITISSSSVTVMSGNVVLYGSKEFVWNGTAWEELGNEGSYKVVQTAVSSPAASGNATSFIDTISQDTQGKIAVTKKTIPTASGTVAGITLVYPAASCTTFSSDSGTCTPLAVQKGAKQFAITRPASTTIDAIPSFSNTTGDVKNSTIKIEDVVNTRDESQAQVISIPAAGGTKKMVYGYCTDQVDGTSFIGGLFDAGATEFPYSSGLAIGGSSGNLLWKGSKVISAADLGGAVSTITSSNLTASRALVSNSSGKIAVSAVTSTELGYLDGVTSAIQTQLNNKQSKISVGTSVPSTLAAGTFYGVYEA